MAVAVSTPATASAANTSTTTKTATTTTKVATYEYTAKAGDSYTVLARKAVQTYGIVNKVKLSGAQIIAAETFLTNAAGSPYLNLGQAVSMKVDDVKSAITQAQGLSAAQLALWQTYVPFVNFNTDNNG